MYEKRFRLFFLPVLILAGEPFPELTVGFVTVLTPLLSLSMPRLLLPFVFDVLSL